MKPSPLQKPNLLERAIGAISPQWALDRASARGKLVAFGFDGANPGTFRGSSGGASKNGSPEGWRMNRDREELMWDARDLERNSAIVSGILQRLPQYVCHRLEYKPNTGDKDIDKEYADYFHDWCGRADITGRHRLKTLAELALRSMLRDGDAGFIMSKKAGELRLQPIEADRLGGTREPANEDRRVGGIRLGDHGEPVAYRIYNRTVQNQYNFSHEEDPKNFIHVFKPYRYDQYRGVTAFAPVIAHMRDINELIGFEKIAAKWQGSIAGFRRVKDPVDASGAVGWDSTATTTQPATMEIIPGRIQTITDSESVEFATGAQRPSGAFIALNETLIRLIAMGLNLPYGFVWDMAAFGGATGRIEVKQAERSIQSYQQLLVDVMLNRVKDMVLTLGIASRKIPAHPRFKEGSFLFGAWLTADVGYQTQADVQLVQLGLKSRHQFHAENGGSYEETIADIYGEIETQRDLSADKNIPIEMIPGANPMSSTILAAANQSDLPAEELQQPEGPPQAPGAIGTFGDKGVKIILEINKQVADGTLPRDSAVMQVAQIYGITVEEADVFVPQAPLTPKKKES